MSGTYVARPRPVLVTVIAVLMVISGILSMIAGVAIVVLRNNAEFVRESGETASTSLGIGIGALIVGALVTFLAFGLLRGSSTARAVIGVVEVLHIIGAVFMLIRYHGPYRSSAVGTIIFSVIVLWILFGTRKAQDFFA